MGNTTSGEAAKKTAEQEEEARKASEAARAAHNRSLKPKLANGMTRILDAGDLMFLNTRLPVTPRASVWSALYLSYRDGKSFTSLVHSVRNIKNTLIIIKDDGGQVFGLFAGDQWKLPEDLDEEATKEKARAARESRMGRKYVPKKSEGDANFFGDGNCALVGIKPDQSLHRPTRQNSNFMYLQTKWPEKEANGLAMGGMVTRRL
ncbi:PIF1 helicase-like protein [Diplonema papillatum]|nr:PIF1 helicase-like protein [Diplonema papillatum]